MLQLSVNSLSNFVQGKPVGGEAVTDKETGKVSKINQIYPNSSTVMRAIDCVMDREVPKVSYQVHAEAEFLPINPADYPE